MKIEAKSRLRASTDAALLDAADWLGSWFEQSWSIGDNYRTPEFVRTLLAPLVSKVPYVPANARTLRRVVGMDTELALGVLLKMPADQLYSCTELATTKDLTALADQVGANGFDNIYVVELRGSVHELFNYKWVFGPVLRYYEQHYPKDKRIVHLKEQAGYAWQKEVAVFSTSQISAKVTIKL